MSSPSVSLPEKAMKEEIHFRRTPGQRMTEALSPFLSSSIMTQHNLILSIAVYVSHSVGLVAVSMPH